MPGFIKQMVIALMLVLLCFGGSLAIKCVSINNQPCMVRSILIDLNPNELFYYYYCYYYYYYYYYYSLIISMKRCNGSYCTVEDQVGIIYVLNEMEDINLRVFTTMKGINESKILAKHISYECRCNFNGRKCNS